MVVNLQTETFLSLDYYEYVQVQVTVECQTVFEVGLINGLADLQEEVSTAEMTF